MRTTSFQHFCNFNEVFILRVSFKDIACMSNFTSIRNKLSLKYLLKFQFLIFPHIFPSHPWANLIYTLGRTAVYKIVEKATQKRFLFHPQWRFITFFFLFSILPPSFNAKYVCCVYFVYLGHFLDCLGDIYGKIFMVDWIAELYGFLIFAHGREL